MLFESRAADSWGRGDATVEKCKEVGTTYVAYSPLGGWALGGTARVLSDPTVKAVAATHNRTTAAVALRWVAQQGVPFVTASDKKAHAEDDVRNVFNFELSAEEMAQLGAIR